MATTNKSVQRLDNAKLTPLIVHFEIAIPQDLCSEFKEYDNTQRPHQGNDGVTPALSVHRGNTNPSLDDLRVEKLPVLNGLVTGFKLMA